MKALYRKTKRKKHLYYIIYLEICYQIEKIRCSWVIYDVKKCHGFFFFIYISIGYFTRFSNIRIILSSFQFVTPRIEWINLLFSKKELKNKLHTHLMPCRYLNNSVYGNCCRYSSLLYVQLIHTSLDYIIQYIYLHTLQYVFQRLRSKEGIFLFRTKRIIFR